MSFRMHSKNALMIALAGTTAFASVAPSKVFAQSPSQLSAQDRKELAGLSEAQRLALQFLVTATIVEGQAGELAKVDPTVAAKYDRIESIYMNTVPTSSVTLAAIGLVGYSVQKVDFKFELLTKLFRASGDSLEWSGKHLTRSSEKIGLDRAFDWSSKRSEKTWEFIAAVLKPLITRNVKLFSGTGSAVSVAAGSVYFVSNDSNTAMSWDTVRALLGQDAVVRARVDELVSGIAPIINLSADGQAKLKVLIFDDIIRQAKDNDFDPDARKYSLDLVDLMTKNQLIDGNMSNALKSIQAVTESITPEKGGSMSVADATRQHVGVSLALAAILETQLKSDKVKNPSTRAEIQRMLGALNANLMLVGYSLKK